VRMLIQVHPPGTDLETHRVPDSRWVAGPATRMAELCRGVNIPLGLITNGEEWMLVHARRGEISGFASFHAHLWVEEPITLRAFASLLGCGTFFARGEDETPERILARSQENQQEVTDQLGLQVRKAVEILVQTLDRIDRDARGTLLEGIADHELYECAVTVMMLLVFLLCAEERGLIVEDDPFYTASYAVGPLKDTLRAEAANPERRDPGTPPRCLCATPGHVPDGLRGGGASPAPAAGLRRPSLRSGSLPVPEGSESWILVPGHTGEAPGGG